MLWRFLIHNKDTESYAELLYNWDEDVYSMTIFDNCNKYYDICPLMIWHWSERGQKSVSDKNCRGFIGDRVIPAGRQNMGVILRELGLKFYHECFMLKYIPTCVMDDAYITLVDEDYNPDTPRSYTSKEIMEIHDAIQNSVEKENSYE